MLEFLKKKKISLRPVALGKIVEITEVPDAVFAEKMVGDGYAILPENNIIVAPVDGKIVHIFPTNHAFGMITDQGVEILVHIGLDTVELNGKGFKRLANVASYVKSGDPIIEIDAAFIVSQGKPLITSVVVTNMEKVESIEVNLSGKGKIAAVVNLK